MAFKRKPVALEGLFAGEQLLSVLPFEVVTAVISKIPHHSPTRPVAGKWVTSNGAISWGSLPLAQTESR